MDAYIRVPASDGSYGYWPYDGSQMTDTQANTAFSAALAAAATLAAKNALLLRTQPALKPGFSGWKVRSSATNVEAAQYGYPRTLLGTHNGFNVYAGTGLNHLIEQYGTSPDQFAPKGVNLAGIVLAAGAVIPQGIQTDFYGQSPPPNFLKPAGYRKRYFGGKADQPYYELSDEADETPTTVVTPIDPGTTDPGTTQNYSTKGDLVKYIQA